MMKETVVIAWVSNIVFEPYLQASINNLFLQAKLNVQLKFIMYNEICKNIDLFQNVGIVVICMNFFELYPTMITNILESDDIAKQFYYSINKKNIELLSFVKTHSNAKVIWFGFEDYSSKNSLVFGAKSEVYGLVDKINIALCNFLSDDIYIDLKKLIAEIGISKAYDIKGKYRWGIPYSKELIKLMANEIYKQYLIEIGITKKCLVLDCDNVLWGGILSEDGIENIKLSGSGFGRLYQDFQRFVLSLCYHGVILAVCSKNDLSDVLTMFREHSEMILKEEHIACFQINWEDKPHNIRMIAEKLNIALDSMVFVDDSPAEIGAVKMMLPEVTAILFEHDMDYEQFSCFNLKSDVCLADIEKRNETYRTNWQREVLKEKSYSYDEYVRALDIKTKIHRATLIEYNRISELTQRTNKCTNGKRFTVAEIKECVETGTIELYSVHVSDRFSDLGLVGVFAVKGSELILFCLSCRALGREIEDEMLEYIVSHWHIEKAFFKLTKKNEDLKNLLAERINLTFLA